MTFQRALWPTAVFLLLLIAIHLLAVFTGGPMLRLGIYPLDPTYLSGIFTAPLIHASWEHLAANSLPVLLLGTALRLGYPNSWKWVVPAIWISSGFAVWIFARQSSHIGASGLTHGLMFFIFVAGILRRDKASSALAMIVFFMYGGMVMSILPRDADVSFEFHLFGALAGVILSFIFRNYDPKPPRKHYDWEDEDDEESDRSSHHPENPHPLGRLASRQIPQLHFTACHPQQRQAQQRHRSQIKNRRRLTRCA